MQVDNINLDTLLPFMAAHLDNYLDVLVSVIQAIVIPLLAEVG